MVSRTGQANHGRAAMAAICAVVLAICGCASSAPTALGDDVMVGRPQPESPRSDSPPPRRGALWYHLRPTDNTLAVRMRLLNPPAQATFFLPGPWAGRGDFDELISLGQAHGDQGPLPLRVDRDEGRLDIDTEGAQWIELTYDVHTEGTRQETHRFSPWQRDDAFFAYAPTILILPSAGVADQLVDIPIELHLPQAWTVAHTWPQMHRADTDDGGLVTGFVADDVRSLRDAFIAAGAQWKTEVTDLKNGHLALTFSDDFSFDEDRFFSAATAICGDYLGRYGHYADLSAFVMPTLGESAHNLRGSGRRAGFVLEVPTDHALDDDLLLLMAHEALHMWNGHLLIPARDADEQTEWFKEGVTHYLALKTLARLGLIDARGVRQELALTAQYYRRNPIVAGGQVRSVDRRRFPYDQGVLIALALDLILYQTSRGQVSVDDWLYLLLAPAFADVADSYDETDLRDAFRQIAHELGPAPVQRYDELVTQRQTLNAADLFRRLGLHLIDAQRNAAPRLLPLDQGPAAFDAIFFDISRPTFEEASRD